MNEKIQESDIVLTESEVAASSRGSDEVNAHADVQVPGYSSLTKVAEGASGTVYSARRDADGRAVAVKIYKKDLTPNAEAHRRFEHEVSMLSRLSHPNIVKILGSGVTDAGASYIAMEIVDGDSVKAILDKDGAFEPRRAVTIAREICRALSAAHEKEIIHRDLKPNNIVVDHNNIAKVVDFGVAKAVGSSNDTITQFGAIIGTPSYMSPEQCLGQKVDQRSDVYSLGCTLFEMLTAKKAFDSGAAMEVLAKQIDTDRSHLKPMLDDKNISTDLQRIVLKCLERKPEKRFDSVAALDHALSAYLLDVGANSASASGRLSQTTVTVLSICALIVVLMTFEMVLWNARTSMEAAPKSSNPPNSIRITRDGAVVMGLNSAATASNFASPYQIEIKNRMTGAVIYTSNKPGVDLKKALSEAAQKGISFSFADLHGANLIQAKLTGVDLRRADLTDARLQQAVLTDVNLDGAIMTKANLTQAHLVRVSLRDAKMSSADLAQCHAPYTSMSGADLSLSKLTQADLSNSDCRAVNFTNAQMIQTQFGGTDITRANFQTSSRWNKPNLHNAIINGVRLQ